MKKNRKIEKRCLCPYCDEEINSKDFPFCHSCSVLFLRCTECKTIVSDRDIETCPECGKPLKKD